MFESLTGPLIIIIISIVVFREFELPGMEYILTVFYAGFFVVLVMIVGMIKNKLLPLKRNPKRDLPIYPSSAKSFNLI